MKMQPWFKYFVLMGLFPFLLGGCGQTLWPSANEEVPKIYTGNVPATQIGLGNKPIIGNPQQASVAKASNPDENSDSPSDMMKELGASRPIMTLYFDNAEINYQRSLFKVVEAILPQKTNAIFTLWLVSPAEATAEVERTLNFGLKVRQSLMDMGVMPQNIKSFQAVIDGNYAKIMVYVQ